MSTPPYYDNPFESEETVERQHRRIARMIRENVDKREGVAAPLEPSTERFNWTEYGMQKHAVGYWITQTDARRLAAAVSKNLREELAEINRVITERFGELKCSTKDDEGNQLDASDLICILATRLELSRQNFAKAESRISELEKEIAALRKAVG